MINFLILLISEKIYDYFSDFIKHTSRPSTLTGSPGRAEVSNSSVISR